MNWNIYGVALLITSHIILAFGRQTFNLVYHD